MSGEKSGSIVVAIAGGAVVLAASLAGGAALLAGKGIVGTVRGTADIVGDAQRGRRMRKGFDQSRQQSEQQQKNLDEKLNERDRAYGQRISGLKQEQKDMLQSFSRTTREQRKQYEQKLTMLRQTQQKYIDKRCRNIENDLERVEKGFDNRMDDMVQQVEHQFSEERQRVDLAFKEERQAVAQAMESQRISLQTQIDSLQSHIENSRETASDWLSILDTETLFIRDNYRHKFFCPGELERIEERLAMAQTNLKQDIFEVSLSQEAFIQARTLRDRLEYLEQEWESNRIMAMELLDSALNSYEACKEFEMSPVEILGENETADGVPGESIEVNTDEWTNGQWEKEHQQLNKARQSISRPDAAKTLDELHEVQKKADSAISRAPVLAVKAKCAVIASALRVDMQQQIFEKLSAAGYHLEGNEWEDDDWRKANHVVLEGANNEKIAISITPGEEGETTINQIDLAFQDENCNEEERREKLDAITAAMSDAYDLPKDQLHFALKPGASWTGNAPAERFDLSRLKAKT